MPSLTKTSKGPLAFTAEGLERFYPSRNDACSSPCRFVIVQYNARSSSKSHTLKYGLFCFLCGFYLLRIDIALSPSLSLSLYYIYISTDTLYLLRISCTTTPLHLVVIGRITLRFLVEPCGHPVISLPKNIISSSFDRPPKRGNDSGSKQESRHL